MKQIISLVFILFYCFQVNAQCLSGDCKNGKGIYLYPSGAKYVGEFEDGEIHGIGTCYYTDGSRYQGEWSHRYPEGNGTKFLEDGSEWTGQWKKGQPIDNQGLVVENIFGGEEEEDDGTDVQIGCLTGDCSGGEGTFAYADGSRYEGQFLNNKPDGWGTFFYIDDDKYIGGFANGYPNGRGTLYHADGDMTTGDWREGEYLGDNTIQKGREGCIDGNCENGRGTYIYKNGAAKYIGEFANSLPDGNGAVTYANGEKYIGDWKAGSFSGVGTLYLLDGSKVKGLWEDGTYMGDAMESEPATEEVVYLEEIKDETPIKETPIAITSEPVVDAPKEEIETIIENAVTEAPDMKVWAVIVGVASYNHMPTLRYTDDDAYRMYAFLKSPEGGALKNDQMRILIDEDATKVKITKAMEDVFLQAGPNDLVLMYFSGHGLRGSFIPIDFDGFNNKLEHAEINAILKESPAKYKLCIADACHSGSALAVRSGNVSNTLSTYYTNLAKAQAGTALIMSSKSEETSLESSGLRQGVFSHFLIRGLQGEADLNQNGIVSVSELYAFIEKNVRSYTGHRQSPVISGDYDGNMTVGVVRE